MRTKHFQPLLVPLLGYALLLSGGCSRVTLPTVDDLPIVYKIDIQQGNVMTQDMVAQLQRGMSKAKVRFIMGTPMIMDTFHSDRWDYFYSLQEGGGDRAQRHISLFFEDEKLAYAEGDVRASLGRLQIERQRGTLVDVPEAPDYTIMAKLKSKVGLGGKGEVKSAEETNEQIEEQEEKGLMARLKGTIGFGNDDKGVEIIVPADGRHLEDEDEGFLRGLLGDGDSTESEVPDAIAEEEQFAAELEQTQTAEVIVPPDAPMERKKGFFGRMLEKIGIGDDVEGGKEGDLDPTDPRYRDPTDPESSERF